MRLFTVGYEGRSVADLVSVLQANDVKRVVDVRDRPWSRKRGFSALALFEALRKAGIKYESERGLGNPESIRMLWKNGSLAEGKRRYRAHLRNGQSGHVDGLLTLARHDRVAILCYEADHVNCHRDIIAEEAASRRKTLKVEHL